VTGGYVLCVTDACTHGPAVGRDAIEVCCAPRLLGVGLWPQLNQHRRAPAPHRARATATHSQRTRAHAYARAYMRQAASICRPLCASCARRCGFRATRGVSARCTHRTASRAQAPAALAAAAAFGASRHPGLAAQHGPAHPPFPQRRLGRVGATPRDGAAGCPARPAPRRRPAHGGCFGGRLLRMCHRGAARHRHRSSCSRVYAYA
jgi:hypothetical protein